MTEMKGMYFPIVGKRMIQTKRIPMNSLDIGEAGQPFNRKKRKWNGSNVNLGKISTKHGRSMDDQDISGVVFWSDGPGSKIFFSGRSFKGVPEKEPYITVDVTGYKYLRAQGLKEDTHDRRAISRIIRASAFLRDNGLPTERITRVEQVTKVRHNGKMIPIDDWKDLVRINKRILLSPNQPLVPAEDVSAFVDDLDFFVLEREMQTSERLIDLAMINFSLEGEDDPELVQVDHSESIIGVESGEDDFKITFLGENEVKVSGKTFRKRMGRIFNIVNLYEGRLGTNWTFSVENNDDIKKYFQEYLPSQMGDYMGRFHKLGIAHTFPHAQNWTAVGTLIDLDSIHGRGLYPSDEVITDEDKKIDLIRSLSSLSNIYGKKSPKASIDSPLGDRHEYKGYLNQIGCDYGEMESESISNFIVEYLSSTEEVNNFDNIHLAIEKFKDIMGNEEFWDDNGYRLTEYHIGENNYQKIQQKLIAKINK